MRWKHGGLALAGWAVTCCLIFLSRNGDHQQSENVELESDEMKTIEGMLNHIHSLTHDARTGHKKETKHRTHDMSHFREDDHNSHDSSDADTSKASKGKHEDKALLEAERAMSGLTHADANRDRGSKTPSKKKLLMMKKMKALQEKILNDFKSVTKIGKKAGYLPPIQMPHM